MMPQLDIVDQAHTLVQPLVTAAGEIHAREGFVLQIQQDGKIIAQGECAPLPAFSPDTLEDCKAYAQRWLNTPADDLALWQQRAAEPTHLPALRCAVQTLICDLAHHHGQPLKHWPPSARTQVRVNALAHDASSAQKRVDEGFRVLKIKVGAAPLRDDVGRIQHIRQQVGDTITLRLDANRAWSMADAANAVEAFQPARIALLEEPLAHGGAQELAELRTQSPIALAADEQARNSEQIRELIDANAVDAIVLKPMIVGGPITCLQLAHYARQRGVYSIITTTIDGPIATRMAAHIAARLPDDRAHGLGTALLFEDPQGFPPITDGHILLGDRT